MAQHEVGEGFHSAAGSAGGQRRQGVLVHLVIHQLEGEAELEAELGGGGHMRVPVADDQGAGGQQADITPSEGP